MVQQNASPSAHRIKANGILISSQNDKAKATPTNFKNTPPTKTNNVIINNVIKSSTLSITKNSNEFVFQF